MKLVGAYREKAGLAQKMQTTEELCRLIEPDLRFFMFGRIQPPAGQDVLHDAVRDIFRVLNKFEGDTAKQFWAWCYRITRNKINDHFREKAMDRTQTMPPEELAQLLESSVQEKPVSPALRLDK